MSSSARRRLADVLEERRLPHVGRVVRERELRAGRAREGTPALVAVPDACRTRARTAPGQRVLDDGARSPRPTARARAGTPARRSRRCRAARAARSMPTLPDERVGDDERGRREVARAHLRMDAALEVAVAREHRRRRRARPRRPRPRPARAAGPSSRCRSCSRSRRAGSRAGRDTASARRASR